MRTLILSGAATICASLLLAGCAQSTTPSGNTNSPMSPSQSATDPTETRQDARAVLLGARNATQTAISANVSVEVIIDIADESQTIESSGSVDFPKRQSQVSIIRDNGTDAVQVSTEKLTYTKVDDQWFAMRSADSVPHVLDGFATLDVIESLSKVVLDGTETLGGVTLTRFVTDVDATQAITLAGISMEDREQLSLETGEATGRITYWVDEESRIVRVDFVGEYLRAADVIARSSTTTTFSNFGAEPDINIPDKADVLDVQ